MPKELRESLFDRFRYSAVPAFRLNSVRFKSRRDFIEAIDSRQLRTQDIRFCDCGFQVVSLP